MSNFKLVRVRFHDAQSSDEWENIEAEVNFPVVESVGFLIANNNNGISLAPNLDRVNKKVSCRMDIPVGAIIDAFYAGTGRKMRIHGKL